jgi:hypothetical protein
MQDFFVSCVQLGLEGHALEVYLLTYSLTRIGL